MKKLFMLVGLLVSLQAVADLSIPSTGFTVEGKECFNPWSMPDYTQAEKKADLIANTLCFPQSALRLSDYSDDFLFDACPSHSTEEIASATYRCENL